MKKITNQFKNSEFPGKIKKNNIFPGKVSGASLINGVIPKMGIWFLKQKGIRSMLKKIGLSRLTVVSVMSLSSFVVNDTASGGIIVNSGKEVRV